MAEDVHKAQDPLESGAGDDRHAGHVGADGEAVAAGRELAVLDAVPRPEEREAVKLPMYSTRGTTPGLRGCWALNKAGEPCGAARRADTDYCNVHSGRP